MNNLFRKKRILVVGDIILDRYVFGKSDRISPEAPVPIITITKEVLRLGGAGNVARNVAHLGSETTLLGVVGSDTESEIVKDLAVADEIKSVFFKSQNPTIVKTRVLAQGQQLLRLDSEKQVPPGISADLATKFCEIVHDYDIVVCSDYGKGALFQIEKIINVCNEASVPIIVDPKGNDFIKYTGATLITPNKKEFEIIVGKCDDLKKLELKAFRLINDLKIKYLLVTKGSEGMSLFKSDGNLNHINTEAADVFDVTGAGDTVCAVMGVAMSSSDYKIEEAVSLANTAAGIVVKKMGAAVIEPFELEWALKKNSYKIFDCASSLAKFCKILKRQNKKIVFTNGCFDFIHAGHVRYLKDASELGDVLVLGLNSDASITRQKGVGRPVNNFKDRAEVLSALSVVNFIIEFSEDSPINLINTIEPDILVKGGDYKEHEIVGYNEVKSKGGRVKSLGFYSEYSTTKLIKKIRSYNK